MLEYLEVLAYLHDMIRPRTYLEVGVGGGDSLRLARGDSICVGVDPEPDLSPGDAGHCHIEVATSDAFFAGARPRELFGDRSLDMAFIDGMHLFEYALRDFINVEALASPTSLVVVHDCLPQDAAAASRKPVTRHWTGDVWKLVLCLLDHRPDLDLSILDVPPSGLCLVRRLNPRDRTLRESYDAMVEQYLPLGFREWQDRLADVLLRTTRGPEARYWLERRQEPTLQERLADSEARAAELKLELQALHASTSWRITAPLRWIGRVLLGRDVGIGSQRAVGWRQP